MEAAELRAMQAPIMQRYNADPAAAVLTLKAKGSLEEASSARKLETGRALAIAGLHPATGGSGLEFRSGVTLKAVATALAIPLKSGAVSAEGGLDFRGTLGVAKDAPVGFRAIPLRFHLDTDAPQEQLDQLVKLTGRYCVVYQTVAKGSPVDIRPERM